MKDRYDTIKLEKATFTEDGFLQDNPIVTRTGIFEYLNQDGSIRREYRPPEEVFNADSLASLKGKPITLKHPNQPVTAENASRLTVGTVLSEGKQDNEFMRADIVIHDKKAINSGKKELSLGYKVDLLETPGTTPNGEKYDAIQTNIRYNHLAIVDSARAGKKARLNLDGNEIYEDEEEIKTMPKIRLDNGLEYEASQEVIVAFDKLKVDSATLQIKVDKTEAIVDTLKADNKKLDEQLKAKDKEHADGLNEAVKQRVSLLSVAEKHKVEKADEMTDRQIKEAVITAVRGDGMELDKKSDEYVQAAFDLVKEDSVTHEDAATRNRRILNEKIKNDGKTQELSSSERREKMIEDLKNDHKEEKK